MSLKDYHKKRDFSKTPEPSGTKTARTAHNLIFVIQEHAASHLHYDFRLQIGHTLKSWAVPKGPSLNPATKRLAIHVEDHPLEYANFEGIIPKDEYGGGTVMIWDFGTWEIESGTNVQDAYRTGKLIFDLIGKKLKGKWSLVKMHGPASNDGKNWLLIKNHDHYASATIDITEEKPLSAKTKRSLAQIQAEAE